MLISIMPMGIFRFWRNEEFSFSKEVHRPSIVFFPQGHLLAFGLLMQIPAVNTFTYDLDELEAK